jgi:hypothetical protein
MQGIQDDRVSLGRMTLGVADKIEALASQGFAPEGVDVIKSFEVFNHSGHPGDPVIPLDVLAREAVSASAREEFGEHVVVAGEEHGWAIDGGPVGHPIIVSDPLDGSTNLQVLSGCWGTTSLLYRQGAGLVAGAVAIPHRAFCFDVYGCAEVQASDGKTYLAGLAGPPSSIVSALRQRPPRVVNVAGVGADLPRMQRLLMWAQRFQDNLKREFPSWAEDARSKVKLFGTGGAPTVASLAYGGLDLEVKLDRSTIYDAAHLPFHAARGSVVADLDAGHLVDWHTVLGWFRNPTDRRVVPPYVVSKHASLAEVALDVDVARNAA